MIEFFFFFCLLLAYPSYLLVYIWLFLSSFLCIVGLLVMGLVGLYRDGYLSMVT